MNRVKLTNLNQTEEILQPLNSPPYLQAIAKKPLSSASNSSSSINTLSATMQNIQQTFTDSHNTLAFELQLKSEQLHKRSEESSEENKRHIEELKDLEKEMLGRFKCMHMEDRSKKWGAEMESTVRGIMRQSAGEGRRKMARCGTATKTLQNKLSQLSQNLKDQHKDNTKNWQQSIEEISEQMINLEHTMSELSQLSNERLYQLEASIIELEQKSGKSINEEREKRETEHQYLFKVVEGIGNKLLMAE